MQVDNLEGEWASSCHMTQHRVDIEDIKFKTLENSKLAEDHIVICGMVENIKHFVTPLRAQHLSKISPIVIFNSDKPTTKQWQPLSRFPQIYFV